MTHPTKTSAAVLANLRALCDEVVPKLEKASEAAESFGTACTALSSALASMSALQVALLREQLANQRAAEPIEIPTAE